MMRDGDILELVPSMERAQKYGSGISNSLVSCKIDFPFCCRLGIFMSHVPWLGEASLAYPELIPDFTKFRRYAQERAMRRVKDGSRTKDLFYHLVGSNFRISTSKRDVHG